MTQSLLSPIPRLGASPWDSDEWCYQHIGTNGYGGAYKRTLYTSAKLEDIVPDGYTVVARMGSAAYGNIQLLDVTQDGELHLILSMSETGGYLTIGVICLDPLRYDEGVSLVDKICADLPPIKNDDPDRVRVEFWHQQANGAPGSRVRSLRVPAWDVIADNYTANARNAIKELTQLDKVQASEGGKIVVLHGPVGTGKTTALRALSVAWRKWVEVHYITDPERMLISGDYLWEVVMSDTNSRDDNESRWRMIIMEDVDELIREDAKAHVGQAFSRLLNLGDGFLGQGLGVIFLLTTNEPIHKLAPAITRAGRCLANIEVGHLSAEEATKWAGKEHKAASLAELYEERAAANQIISKTAVTTTGQYL